MGALPARQAAARAAGRAGGPGPRRRDGLGDDRARRRPSAEPAAPAWDERLPGGDDPAGRVSTGSRGRAAGTSSSRPRRPALTRRRRALRRAPGRRRSSSTRTSRTTRSRRSPTRSRQRCGRRIAPRPCGRARRAGRWPPCGSRSSRRPGSRATRPSSSTTADELDADGRRRAVYGSVPAFERAGRRTAARTSSAPSGSTATSGRSRRCLCRRPAGRSP